MPAQKKRDDDDDEEGGGGGDDQSNEETTGSTAQRLGADKALDKAAAALAAVGIKAPAGSASASSALGATSSTRSSRGGAGAGAGAAGSASLATGVFDDEPSMDTRLLYVVTTMKRTEPDSGLEFIKRLRKVPGCGRTMVCVFSASTARDPEMKAKCVDAAGGKRLVSFLFRAKDVVEHSKQFCKPDPDGGLKGRSEMTPHASMFRALMSVPRAKDPIFLLISSVFSPVHRGHQSMIKAVTLYFGRHFSRCHIAAVVLSPMGDGPGKDRLLKAGHPAAAFLPISIRATLTQLAVLDMPEVPAVVDNWEAAQNSDDLTPDQTAKHLRAFLVNRGEPERIRCPRVLVVVGDDRVRDDPALLEPYRNKPDIGLVVITRGVGPVPPHISKIAEMTRQEQWDQGLFVVPAIDDTITSDQVLTRLVLGGRIEEVLHPRVASFYYARRAQKEAQAKRDQLKLSLKPPKPQKPGDPAAAGLPGGAANAALNFPPPPPQYEALKREQQLQQQAAEQFERERERVRREMEKEEKERKAKKEKKDKSGKRKKKRKSKSGKESKKTEK
jgi:nicotinic acid mononucleotide adenylyltransferase